MQIMWRKWLIKSVLKGKNIFRTRPLNHTQKKKNYDCFYAHKNKIYDFLRLIKIKNMNLLTVTANELVSLDVFEHFTRWFGLNRRQVLA